MINIEKYLFIPANNLLLFKPILSTNAFSQFHLKLAQLSAWENVKIFCLNVKGFSIISVPSCQNMTHASGFPFKFEPSNCFSLPILLLKGK